MGKNIRTANQLDGEKPWFPATFPSNRLKSSQWNEEI